MLPGGETEHYEAGTATTLFRWDGFTVSPFICYDLRFPEHFRKATRAGAQLITVIASWPVARIGHWITLLQARAVENQAYVVGVNRTGDEPDFSYCGRSIVVDPHGQVVFDAGEEEGVGHVTLDPKLPATWREEFPAYHDFLRWS